MTSDELNNAAARLCARYLKAEARGSRSHADKLFNELWSLMTGTLVKSTKMMQFVSGYTTAADLRQALRVGLLDACHAYDPAKGAIVPLAVTIAKRRIYDYTVYSSGAITHGLYAHQGRKLWHTRAAELANTLGRDPDPDEVIDAAQTPLERMMLKHTAKFPIPEAVVLMRSPDSEHDYGDPLEEFFADPESAFDDADTAADLQAAWQRWLKIASPHQRQCLLAYYGAQPSGDAVSMSTAAEIVGCNLKSVDNALSNYRDKVQARAAAALAEQGLTIASATFDDILALPHLPPTEGIVPRKKPI